MNEALKTLIATFDGRAERIDGSMLELKNLPDLLMGGTLFADKRLVIIKDLSSNASVWEKLPEWLPRISDDIQLVLVDAKPDKRKTAYKEIKKVADIKDFTPWGDRDYPAAEAWVSKRASTIDLKLDKKLARHIVDRIGLDQWQLADALDKLLSVEEVSAEVINEVIDANPVENVFQLFETALEGHATKVHAMLRTLELTEDPYKLFALLSSQVFQLAGVASATAGDNPSKDLAIHPFVASKLSRHAKKYGRNGAVKLVRGFAKADADMKLSRGDPWLLIERALLSI